VTTYQVLFDVAAEGYSTWRFAVTPALVGIAMGCLSIWHRVVFSRVGRPGPRFYAAVTGVAAIVVSCFAVRLAVDTREEYEMLSEALRRGNYRVVEGRVTDFVAGGAGGHGAERFRVGKFQFVYSASSITSAFHRTRPYGGPIRDGLLVRIADVKGLIARLEVSD
jgi:hypothetical protein